MKRTIKIIAIIVLLFIALLAWAPWITEEYAIGKVTEMLGGPDAQFHYIDKTMPVKDIPKEVNWLPFVKFVTFPGEAGWFVTFLGIVV